MTISVVSNGWNTELILTPNYLKALMKGDGSQIIQDLQMLLHSSKAGAWHTRQRPLFVPGFLHCSSVLVCKTRLLSCRPIALNLLSQDAVSQDNWEVSWLSFVNLKRKSHYIPWMGNAMQGSIIIMMIIIKHFSLSICSIDNLFAIIISVWIFIRTVEI